MAKEYTMRLQVKKTQGVSFKPGEVDRLADVLNDIWGTWGELHVGESESVLETEGMGTLRGIMNLAFFVEWVRSAIWEEFKFYLEVNIGADQHDKDPYDYKSQLSSYTGWEKRCVG